MGRPTAGFRRDDPPNAPRHGCSFETGLCRTPAFALAIDPTRPPPGLERAVYAIGNFDGVHRGHGAVIARTQALAAERGAPSAVLTFEPHPADYFAGRPVVFRLTPLRDQGARACNRSGSTARCS